MKNISPVIIVLLVCSLPLIFYKVYLPNRNVNWTLTTPDFTITDLQMKKDSVYEYWYELKEDGTVEKLCKKRNN